MELPPHPDADDTGADRQPATTVSWGAVLVVAVVATVLAAIVILHLTGVVGPGAH